MSPLHHFKKVSNRPNRNPQLMLDCNATKGTVDTLDEFLNMYTCKRKNNSWPVLIFYNVLHTSIYYSFILWTSIHNEWNNNNTDKKKAVFWKNSGNHAFFSRIEARQHLSKGEDSTKVVKLYRVKNKI